MASTHYVQAPPPQGGVVIAPVGRIDPQREKQKMKLYSFGITEVVFGSLSCVLCIITLIIAPSPYYSPFYAMTFISTGLWCGMFAIISGSLGICTRKKPTTSMYNANLAMSIVAAVFMGIQVILSGISADPFFVGLLIIHSLIGIIGFACMVICIVHAAYCCAGVCCYKNDLPPTQVTYNAAQQFVQLPNGQLALLVNQPQTFAAPFQGGLPVTSIPGNVGVPQQQGYPVAAQMGAPSTLNITPGPSNPSQYQQQQESKLLPPNPPVYSE